MKIDVTRAPWRKSSYSGGNGGSCVEVAPVPGMVGVRDTKDRARGHFAVTRAAWQEFAAAAASGQFSGR